MQPYASIPALRLPPPAIPLQEQRPDDVPAQERSPETRLCDAASPVFGSSLSADRSASVLCNSPEFGLQSATHNGSPEFPPRYRWNPSGQLQRSSLPAVSLNSSPPFPLRTATPDSPPFPSRAATPDSSLFIPRHASPPAAQQEDHEPLQEQKQN